MRKVAVLASVVLLCALVAPLAVRAQQKAKREFLLHGEVKKVDVNARTLTVDYEGIDGWMARMTMVFSVDKPDILTKVKAGDRITATVREGDLTHLYGVAVVAPVVTPKPPPKGNLPPLSYVCTSPGEESVLENEPGKCPQSGLSRVPIRLVTAYSCLKVQTVIQDKPGVCPVDRSALVPITAALY